jgi:hypothetical protein
VEKLDQQLARLGQIRELLAQDHNLRNPADVAIAMQVGASEHEIFKSRSSIRCSHLFLQVNLPDVGETLACERRSSSVFMSG